MKLDGILEINEVDKNNNAFTKEELIIDKHISKNKYTLKTIDQIFIRCNLIDDSYINNRKINSIYRFRLDNKEINAEPKQIIYHKVSNKPDKIILSLVDANNNLIDFDSINLFVELNMKELKI
jgi:hypothetical protein